MIRTLDFESECVSYVVSITEKKELNLTRAFDTSDRAG
jgi:hypothetical protein